MLTHSSQICTGPQPEISGGGFFLKKCGIKGVVTKHNALGAYIHGVCMDSPHS